MGEQLVHVIRMLFTALAALATLAGVFIVVLVGSSVTMRHIADAPFRFTEELVGLLMTAAFFLALPLVTLNTDHVRVQVLVNALPSKLARSVSFAAAIFGIAFSVWFAWLCIPWFEFAFERNIKTEASRLLMYPWMALLPLSMSLTAIAFACQLHQSFKQPPHASTQRASAKTIGDNDSLG